MTTATASLTIHQTRETLPGNATIDGRPHSYTTYNASGRGKLVATIAGPVELVRSPIPCSTQTADLGLLDDGKAYCLRDVLEFARRGERGLSIVAD